VLATTEVDERGRSAVFGGGGILGEIGARAGNANVEPDGDGITRRMGREIDGLAGFSTAIVESATGRPVDRSVFDRDGDAVIDSGPPGTVRTLSLSRVVRGRFDPALVRDRIVVVGPSAPSLQDVHPTAAARDRQMSGAELQANAVATILADAPLRDAPAALDLGGSGPPR
jgi:adenylate cyclase